MVIESVVKVVAWPEQIAAQHCFFRKIMLEAPASIWFVILNPLQEKWIKWSTRQVKLLLFACVHDITEMEVAGCIKRLTNTQSVESFIASNLVGGGHFVST